MNSKRTVIKIGGESGQGVNAIGEIIAKALKNHGFFVFGYREYHSLIKGGYSNYQLDFDSQEIHSSIETNYDIAVAVSRVAAHKLIRQIKPAGILVYSVRKMDWTEEELNLAKAQNLNLVFIDTHEILKKIGAKEIMENVLLSGFIWMILGLDFGIIEDSVREMFESKPQFIEINIKCLKTGYEYKNDAVEFKNINLNKAVSDSKSSKKMLISGNHSMSLGIIAAGVRAYYSYPMTPSSSILSYLADTYNHTGMIVKQAEDEITAAQMAIGSMFMGTRALTGTSGGGFDLMTETVSLAAITETPFVCILGQRPGPATGMPTWTAASDLNLAVYSGHGEYTRCVLAASDAISAYEIIQKAFNIAEKFQIPVIVLSEKQIAESLYCVERFPEAIRIERGLTTIESDENGLSKNKDQLMRFKLTQDGVSPRWLPGDSEVTYNGNSDEHFENGRLTEDGAEAKLMQEKRLAKFKPLMDEISEPELFGNETGEILFVGWGSTKGVMTDLIADNQNVSYLHYQYVYPVKTEKLLKIKNDFSRVVLIENNYLGQLGDLIKIEAGIEFKEKLLKYDGRPFFYDELINFLKSSRIEANNLNSLIREA